MPDLARRILIGGELALVLCSVCYITWWALAFRPPITVPRPVGRPFLTAAVVLGALGVLALVVATVWIATVAGSPALWGAFAAVLAGGFLYRILLTLTTQVAHRPLTTELPLIVVWTTLQAAAWAALMRGGVLSGAGVALGWVAIAVTLVVGLGCYLAFYRLPPVPAYVAGMVPLGIAGLAAALLAYVVQTA